MASSQPRNAHIVARDSVSCLVLSPSDPQPFAGRGIEAQFTAGTKVAQVETAHATTCIDVSDYVPQKIAAIAAHRTQCPIAPDMLPERILHELFDCEYFIRIHPQAEVEHDLSTSFFWS